MQLRLFAKLLLFSFFFSLAVFTRPHSHPPELKVTGLTENGSRLVLSAIDPTSKPDGVGTQFAIAYRAISSTAGVNATENSRILYEGIIPRELVNQSADRVILELGKLPIEPEYLKPGVGVEIELAVIRDNGDRATQQTLHWRGEIQP